ncbi:MAG TPA: glycosyltransferase family 2 protein [Burkholderiaceae bacterium]|jgi:rhamnosyltransferase|nr:glycosyltransferase family 2 protein [Burkholderiaceae bacterium]
MTGDIQPVTSIDDRDAVREEADGGDAVCAVIVTYHPDLMRLQALIESVVDQASKVVIVDNGSAAEALNVIRDVALRLKMELIEFGENRGIAAAHNAGIHFAIAQKFSYVLLLDHDSRLQPGCLPQLLQASRRLTDAGIKVAAVGPQYVDETSMQRSFFLRFSRWGLRKVFVENAGDVIEASLIISSGSLIAVDALHAIGLMDETLFIDGVDWEWCFRASARGYRLFGVAAAVMQHNLGDSGVPVLGRAVSLHSPLRHYYMYRNTVLMCKMKQIPLVWKPYVLSRLVLRFCIYMILAPQRRERCKMILRGVYDGLRGRSGPIAQPIR